jgi:antitoxin component YwqK of YwqJK toxin-antitoxin module
MRHRYRYSEGSKVGAALTYHSNGTLKTREQFAINGDWVIEEYSDTEKKIFEKRFRDKQPEGTWIFYYDDGKTERIKENYDKGKLSDTRYEYYPNGKLAKEENFKFDMLNGPFKSYYENGKIEAEGECRSNRKHGLFTAYYGNGQIKEQGEFIADRKHTEWKEYDESGNLVKTLVFRAGILVETKE